MGDGGRWNGLPLRLARSTTATTPTTATAAKPKLSSCDETKIVASNATVQRVGQSRGSGDGHRST